MKRVNKYILAATLVALPVAGNYNLNARAQRSETHKAECGVAVANLLRALNCPADTNIIMQHIENNEAEAIAQLRYVDFDMVKASVMRELQALYIKKMFMFGNATQDKSSKKHQGSALRRFIAEAVTTTSIPSFQQFLTQNSEEISILIAETLEQHLRENQQITNRAITTITHGKSLENMCRNWKLIQAASSVPAAASQPVPCYAGA
jgi:hypothetical protein